MTGFAPSYSANARFVSKRITSGLSVIRPQKRKRLGPLERFYARLWGTKMRGDEERLQRNHHAIPDVFI